jgi:hypothetical protein
MTIMTLIKTVTDEQFLFDFRQDIYDNLLDKYGNLTDFKQRLESFIASLVIDRNKYNINPYSEPINTGIYLLGKYDSELGIFPNANLALKCSQDKFLAEDLRKQFYRSIQLAQNFEDKLNSPEQDLLSVCPVYSYVKTNIKNSFFKHLLFMQRIEGDQTLGNTKSGFSAEFCQVFKIPSLQEISVKRQFALHQALDRDKQRQLLKIQTVYLFRRLWLKGIKIFSLNQKNIMVSQDSKTNRTRYILIDPVPNYLLPISPIYNTLTFPGC